ncbi:MAG TPA: anti-sigma factor, partial [Longimicrobiales bacterium]|nr:anti-sigma factor [Longimicrobiales bacterium]
RAETAESLGRRLRDPLLWEEPSPQLEERVMGALIPDPTQRRRWGGWWLAVAAVAAVVVAMGVISMLGRPDWSLQLEAGPEAPGAIAMVQGWNVGRSTRMVLDLRGLPHPGGDSYFEVWMTAADGSHISAGTFTEPGRVELTAGVHRADYPRVWVTLEPDDGIAAPSRATVLDTPGWDSDGGG